MEGSESGGAKSAGEGCSTAGEKGGVAGYFGIKSRY